MSRTIGRTRKACGTSTTVPLFVEELNLIAAAAAAEGRSISSFIRMSILTGAKETVGTKQGNAILGCKVDK